MDRLNTVEPKPATYALDERQLKAVCLFFIVEALGLTLLQKFALPVGGKPMELCAPMMLAGLAAMTLFGGLTINPMRLLLFCFFLITAAFGQVVSGQAFEITAFVYIVIIYVTLCFEVKVPRETYLYLIDIFQKIMVFCAAIVLVQHAIQFSIGWRFWPNLNQIIPGPLLYSGFNYIQPLEFGSPYMKPSGVVFLEASFLSQFMAIALIVELVLFQRLWRMMLFGMGVFLSFGGTGLLMLVVCAPVLAMRASPRLLILGAIGLVGVVALAGAIGWWSQVGGRLSEFSTPGTSGYYRFTVQWLTIVKMAAQPELILHGYGSGSMVSSDKDFILIPFPRTWFEYGALTAFSLTAFQIVSMFSGAPSKRIAFGLLIYFSLGGGGLAVPVYGLLCTLLCTVLRIDPVDRGVPLLTKGGKPEPRRPAPNVAAA